MHARLTRSSEEKGSTRCLRSVWLRGRPDREPVRIEVFLDEAEARAVAGPEDEVWEVLDLAGRFDGATALMRRLDSDAIGSVLETAVGYARAEEGNQGTLALVNREHGRGVVVTFWEAPRVRHRHASARRFDIVESTDRS